MSKLTVFVQGCPTCGRSLEIKVEHLGRKLICQHCRAEFVATDPDSAPRGSGDRGAIPLMDRVNELLGHAASRQPAPR